MIPRSLPATERTSQSSVRGPTIVVDGLACRIMDAHRSGVPEFGKAIALLAQLGDQAPQPTVGRVTPGGAQVGDERGLKGAQRVRCVVDAVAGAEQVGHTPFSASP